MLKYIATALTITACSAAAEQCTEFESAVFQLADDAHAFQLSYEFEEMGWSAKGPTGDWMSRFQSVQQADNDLHLSFSQKHNFLPADLLDVANAYRTNTFDSFYKGVQNDIQSAGRCK
ncbi:hypothetical protein RA27_02220 [Ruegeria sp. ANG-R]|uniref:hypothetical protein n=1 Tax=Ruegeria sp. ANG-R TaxID=1577903 RepID=UPI00057EA8AE|nr:hypothetical protein [Ruegeria sp. ANG-R]KIC42228.1 hypothetical protein RA27_02220 [Ruegeria sp. ANG-R]